MLRPIVDLLNKVNQGYVRLKNRHAHKKFSFQAVGVILANSTLWNVHVLVCLQGNAPPGI